MAVTVPTVQSSGDTHWNRMQDQTGASAMSMGGGGVRSNNYLLDGFPITDLQNRSSTNPSGEMVEDVRVQVHTYDAEMGRTGGGVLNTTAKSGSEPVPRLGLLLTRPNALIGRKFFNEIRGIENQPQYWRNGGGGFGGPLSGARRSSGRRARAIATASRRTTAARADGGDAQRRLQQLPRRAGPADPHLRSADHRCSGNRQPFPGNIIPRTASTRSGGRSSTRCRCRRSIRSTTTATSTFRRRTSSRPRRSRSLKLDHHFNDAISLNGVYLFQNSFEPDANYFPDAPYAAPSYQLDREVNVFVLNNTYIVSPTTVATFRFGMNTFSDDNSAAVSVRHARQCPASIPRSPTRFRSRSSRR